MPTHPKMHVPKTNTTSLLVLQAISRTAQEVEAVRTAENQTAESTNEEAFLTAGWVGHVVSFDRYGSGQSVCHYL